MFSRVPEKKYDLYEIAKQGGLSYDSFRKKFRFFSGTSPHSFLLDCRFDKAIRLMHDHKLTIKDISNSCGFSSLSVFSRFFYQHCGEYPKAYREKMKRILDV